MIQDKVFYPNVSRPIGTQIESNKIGTNHETSGDSFKKILEKFEFDDENKITFSNHAQQRIESRNIKISENEIEKISNAVRTASQKGIQDSLVLTQDHAYIVNIKNRTVVTAMRRDDMNGVVTNIDGVVFSET